MLQEMLRGLLVGAVGSALRWLGRLLRNAIIAFVVGGAAAFGVSVGAVWLSVGHVPDTASWLLLGAIALIVAMLSALGTATVTVMRSLGRVMHTERGGASGGASGDASATPIVRSPAPDNLRAFPTTRNKRQRVS